MVKILANGDIVPDDDPRAADKGRPNPATQRSPRQQGRVSQIPVVRGGGGGGGGGGISIFSQLNQRLLQAGLPRFNISKYVVEPIVSVGMLVAFMVLGFKGLLIGAVLFFVTKWSEDRGGGDGAGRPAGGWGGQGYRLGR